MATLGIGPKIKDLEKAKQSEKRSIEKDNSIQLELFSKLRKKKKLEVLRMEVRLNKRSKMKHLFAKLSIKSDLSLKSLFKPATSRKVLLHYLDELESKRPAILNYKALNDKTLLTDIILSNPEFGSKKIFQLFGLIKALEIANIRELRRILSKHNLRDWNRLNKDANGIKISNIFSPLKTIKAQILKQPNRITF